jgi:phosphoglycolate phosphatase-like HAD superfamily hydrolase
MSEARIAVLDVDGTLVDTNYQHALAWYRAFRSLGETYPVWRIHRLIGMGGDQLVAALGGDEVEERIGEQARERWVQEFDPMMAETALLPGARELIVALKERGHRVVLVGDSVFDVEAAKNAGMPAIVVRSGGFGDDELRDAGALAIYDTPADLTAALDRTDLS